MISEKIIRLVVWRLAIIKYGYASAFYWDLKTNKLVISPNNKYWTWCILYAFAVSVIPMMCIYICINVHSDEDSVISESNGSSIYKPITLVLTAAIICIMICCVLIVSVLKIHRLEICNLYQTTLILNGTIQGKFKNLKYVEVFLSKLKTK